MRPAQPGATPANAPLPDVAPEITRIVANGLTVGDVSPADRTYLAQLVASRAGISADDARTRVDQAIERTKQAATQAREAADATRKAAMTLSLFGALAMFIGAFIASAAAAYGGQLRDEPS